MKTFSELPLLPVLQANLAQNGFAEATPIQAMAIEPALAGRDLVATAQTGTGKTLAFVLPMIQSSAQQGAPGVRAVILSPTRELALQIHETFAKMAAGSRHPRRRRRRRLERRTAIAGDSQGRASAHRHARPALRFPQPRAGRARRGVRILVLDEADRMLDMGFLPTIKRIMAAIPPSARRCSSRPPSKARSSTWSKRTSATPCAIEMGSTTKPVGDSRTASLRSRAGPQARSAADDAAPTRRVRFWSSPAPSTARTGWPRSSRAQGVKTAAIHGDRSQNQRNQALRGFQDGYYRVLVATDIAARGIHVEGISHVVNYDLPQVPEDFIHRVGRTGRAGAARNRFDLRHALRTQRRGAYRTNPRRAPCPLQRRLQGFERSSRPGANTAAPPVAILQYGDPRS